MEEDNATRSPTDETNSPSDVSANTGGSQSDPMRHAPTGPSPTGPSPEGRSLEGPSLTGSTPAGLGPADGYPYLSEQMLYPVPARRVRLPIILFVLTCFSTFWVGSALWCPEQFLLEDWRLAFIANWRVGLGYMLAVLGILMFHEMGHFLMAVRYGIPASFPYFIPVPISLLGTMGAVIAMAGQRANRREIFDIGIAGPLAGLVVALPVLWIGVCGLDLDQSGYGGIALDLPLLAKLMIRWLHPSHANVDHIWISQVNAFFMAGWVGLFITGLNMVPISQLDGGHVIYALFLKRAHWIARGFLVFVVCYIIFTEAYIWTVMLVFVTLIGTDHPPTSNDQMPLGRGRYALGLISLVIPLFCFPPRGFVHLF